MSIGPTDQLEEALRVARSMLAELRADLLGHPTPCPSWDVRALVDHMVRAPLVAVARMTGQEPPPPAAAPATGAGGAGSWEVGEVVAAHDRSAAAAIATFGTAGALERLVRFPFGTISGRRLRFFVASDQVVHTWDLAIALGRPREVATELSGRLLGEAAEMVTDDLRRADGSGPYGPAQPAPAGAGATDRLAAFLGRIVPPG